MAVKETNIFKLAQMAVSKLGTVIFRNNTGMFFTHTGAAVQCGLCKGSSDGIGWHSVVITPDMVGQKVAVFTALEAKTSTGRATQEQLHFIDQVKRAGGIAGVFRTEQEAVQIVRDRFSRD